MEYKQIIYFITICESNTITKAAEKLSISHQALSRVLNDLEKDLGVDLIIRTPKGVKTTDYGKVLYEAFSGHVAEYGAIEKRVKEHFLNKGENIVFCTPPIVFSSKEIDLIYAYEDLHKDIRLKKKEFSENECVDYLLENPERFAIMPYAQSRYKNRELESIYIKDYPVYVYTHMESGLAKKRKVTPTDLSKENLLVLDRVSENEEHLRYLENKYKIQYNIEHKSSSIAELFDFVNKKRGVMVFFDLEYSKLAYPNVTKVPLYDKGEDVSLRIIFKNKECLPKESLEFIEYIVEKMG